MKISIVKIRAGSAFCCLAICLSDVPRLAIAQALAESGPGVTNWHSPDRVNSAPAYAAYEILVRSKLGGGVVYVDGDVPLAEAPLPGGLSVRDALTLVLSGQNRYEWREASGTINVLPREGVPDLLKTSILFYEWRSNESPSLAVSRLMQLPEVARRMRELNIVEGLHGESYLEKAPKVGSGTIPLESIRSFARQDTSFIDLLNEIAKSYSPPAIWSYYEVTRGKSQAVTLSVH